MFGAADLGPGLDLLAAASVVVYASASFGIRLGLRDASGAGSVPLSSEIVPMPDIVQLTQAGNAPKGASVAQLEINASAAAVTDATAGGRWAIAGGYVVASEATTVQFYDGDPDADGVALTPPIPLGTMPIPLAVLGLYGEVDGNAIYAVTPDAVDVTGRVISVRRS
jgi:hypothetical protein